MRALVLVVSTVLSLTACSKHDAASDAAAAAANRVFTRPGVMIGHGQITMDGVKVFPGSSVGAVSVDNHEALVGFTSPQPLDTVKGYYINQFAAKGVKATANGDGFSGKTRSGDDFSLGFFTKNGVTNATMLIHEAMK